MDADVWMVRYWSTGLIVMQYLIYGNVVLPHAGGEKWGEVFPGADAQWHLF